MYLRIHIDNIVNKCNHIYMLRDLPNKFYLSKSINPTAVYTVKQVVQLLGLHEHTVRRLARSGELRGKRIGEGRGSKFIFLGRWLLEFMETPDNKYLDKVYKEISQKREEKRNQLLDSLKNLKDIDTNT